MAFYMVWGNIKASWNPTLLLKEEVWLACIHGFICESLSEIMCLFLGAWLSWLQR
jgi:hypothetical protein